MSRRKRPANEYSRQRAQLILQRAFNASRRATHRPTPLPIAHLSQETLWDQPIHPLCNVESDQPTPRQRAPLDVQRADHSARHTTWYCEIILMTFHGRSNPGKNKCCIGYWNKQGNTFQLNQTAVEAVGPASDPVHADPDPDKPPPTIDGNYRVITLFSLW